MIIFGDYDDLRPQDVKPYDRWRHQKTVTMHRCGQCGGQLWKFRGTNLLVCERCGENQWLV